MIFGDDKEKRKELIEIITEQTLNKIRMKQDMKDHFKAL